VGVIAFVVDEALALIFVDVKLGNVMLDDCVGIGDAEEVEVGSDEGL